MMTLRPRSFVKMHGLGNDFAIFDAREEPFAPTAAHIKAFGDRKTGIGFDQAIILRPAVKADVFMEIRNKDGSEVSACGNATRCVADIIFREKKTSVCLVETKAGLLTAKRGETGISVDMGRVDFNWSSIPLARSVDTLKVDLGIPTLPPAVCLSVGNPHAVFFVENVSAVPIEAIGPKVECHTMFPEKVNASFVQIGPNHLRVRVWERGVGITRACGTAACAVLAAAAVTGRYSRRGDVVLDGGMLHIHWQDNGHSLMTGPAKFVYKGEVVMESLSL